MPPWNTDVTDVYQHCPDFDTPHFLLRLVRRSDADDLLTCYSDPAAQALFDADNCTSDFRYSTEAEMAECIDLWLHEYAQRHFVRWSIIDRATSKPVGTVEMFSEPGFLDGVTGGVLRIGIGGRFETPGYLVELLDLANRDFPTLFGAQKIATKARPWEQARIAALKAAGYEPFAWSAPDRTYYYAR
jgi:RimJ/RimL family protein N-acetyltransferase